MTLPAPLRLSLAGACLGATLFLGGCATTCTHPPTCTGQHVGDPFAGHWEGTWQSAHGHHGRLLCDFTPLDAHHYKAHFTAYWAALHGSYDVIFETHRVGKSLRFEGSKDLGALYGGLYHYSATSSGGHFHATYTARADNGTFELTRQACPR